MPAIPAPPTGYIFRHSFQSIAVAVSSSLAIQTSQQVIILLSHRSRPRYTRFRHMPCSPTQFARVNSAPFIRTNADFMPHSLAAVTHHINACEGSVSHFSAIHTSHLHTRVGTDTRHMSELLAIKALYSGIWTFEVAVCPLPAARSKSLKERILWCRSFQRHGIRLALEAKESLFSL